MFATHFTIAYAAAISLILFLLPGGRPRRLTVAIHAGGRPRRLVRPCDNRSKVRIASSICSRSRRKSASILRTSIFNPLAPLQIPLNYRLPGAPFGKKNRTAAPPDRCSSSINLSLWRFQELCSEFRTKLQKSFPVTVLKVLAPLKLGGNHYVPLHFRRQPSFPKEIEGQSGDNQHQTDP